MKSNKELIGSWLYKIDSHGKTRIWRMLVGDDSKGGYVQTESGVQGGSTVISKPKHYEAKNVGRSNEKSSIEVAGAAAEKAYKDKRELRGYGTSPDNAVKKEDRFEVTLADRYDKRKDKVKFPVIASPKLDGIRCYINSNGMFSRNHKEHKAAPHIFKSLRQVFANFDITLDGELYNHDLKSDFEKIVSLVRKQKPSDDDIYESMRLVQFHIFDMKFSDADISYNERQTILENILKTHVPKEFRHYFRIVKTKQLNSHEEVEQYHNDCVASGFEGCMLRLEPDKTPYEMKRSKNLLKVKIMHDAEFEIVDFTEGVGNRSGVAGRVICKNDDGETFEAGLSGNMKLFKEYLDNREKYIGKMATIQYQEMTGARKVPRFGVLKSVRDYE